MIAAHRPAPMNVQIASLLERMMEAAAEWQAWDWRLEWKPFCDEIAALHRKATTEEEYVALLEAHRFLVEVAPKVFDEHTSSKIRELAEAEHRFFLISEATEYGRVFDVLMRMERVTRREVEAGRLDPNDGCRTLAVAAAQVLGPAAPMQKG